ncbi:MAG: adenylate/guanylate cyclase domain-containing protein [Polyangiaceae bacterium]
MSDVELLETVFPFHFAIDREMRIVRHGSKLPRLRSAIKIGDAFGDHFRVKKPVRAGSFDEIASQLDALYLVNVVDSPAEMRGQMLRASEDTLLFIGQPLTRNLKEVKALGLSLKDFPLYDTSGDLLFLLQAQQTTIDEARALNGRLSELNDAFRRYVPQEFLRLLRKESIVHIKLGDCIERRMTVLFSDIRSFTTLSESMSPPDTFDFINSYLRAMEPMVGRHHGFIDKYVGDAIMALFDTSPDDAVRAAVDMLLALGGYNDSRAGGGHEPIRIGVGINTGNLMLGTIGGEARMEGTVISDAVNLASRIESMTKTYGVDILVSEDARAAMVDPASFHMREVDHVRVRGKTQAVRLYEVFNADPPELRDGKTATKALFAEALAAFYEHRVDDARAKFEECVRRCPADKAAHLYAERSREGEVSS